ncbi:MAG: hypothetical protein CL683_04515 [Brevundimonas sp.]|nr:hypothetical protein [Brevundimonas sp.]
MQFTVDIDSCQKCQEKSLSVFCPAQDFIEKQENRLLLSSFSHSLSQDSIYIYEASAFIVRSRATFQSILFFDRF